MNHDDAFALVSRLLGDIKPITVYMMFKIAEISLLEVLSEESSGSKSAYEFRRVMREAGVDVDHMLDATRRFQAIMSTDLTGAMPKTGN